MAGKMRRKIRPVWRAEKGVSFRRGRQCNRFPSILRLQSGRWRKCRGRDCVSLQDARIIEETDVTPPCAAWQTCGREAARKGLCRRASVPELPAKKASNRHPWAIVLFCAAGKWVILFLPASAGKTDKGAFHMDTDRIYAEAIANEYAPKNTPRWWRSGSSTERPRAGRTYSPIRLA